MLAHFTLSVTPGGCSTKMFFTLLFSVLPHTLTQLLVTTQCHVGFVSQAHKFLSFFYFAVVSDHCLDLRTFTFLVS